MNFKKTFAFVVLVGLIIDGGEQSWAQTTNVRIALTASAASRRFILAKTWEFLKSMV
ncbi:MAG TPA: hypothetical protein VGK57_14675 [Candidatus Binatia bacterium]|jgi:hypothetical protein